MDSFSLSNLRLSLEDEPSPADRQVLEDGLYLFNSLQLERDDGRLLAVFLRDEQGEVFGGLMGWTWAGVCEIQALWVYPALRGQGYGLQLMEAAEAEARARGVEWIQVSSYSFQAPEFYQKLGYQIVGRLEDWPPGHQHYFLRKRLE